MIAIVDYKAGNLGSLANAVKDLGFDCEITSDPKEILKARKVIFPGQGRAASALKELKKTGVDKIIKNIRVPFLGICLGMQLLADYSVEDNINCLSIIPGSVFNFPGGLKVPQMGWNSVKIKKRSKLFKGIKDNSYFYFANSYYVNCPDIYLAGSTGYGIEFASSVQKDNYYGVQFHPEKSGSEGLKLLRNFCLL